MTLFEKFRDPRFAQEISAEIRRLSHRPVAFMEVCGTHTVAIFKFGLRSLLPPQIRLLSGPGCPVCVTPNRIIDQAIAYCRQPNIILATFGDMLRVPGSSSSLSREKARGRRVEIVYSPIDALAMAAANPTQPVIFFGIGFETTAPTIAVTLLEAQQQKLTNFFILTALKLVPPALVHLLTAASLHLDGFILPGHVSAIIGSEPYSFIPKQYGIPGVITGFEPIDILQAILMLVRQIETAATARIENQYQRVVAAAGNLTALQILNQYFEPADSEWRGLGIIPNSALRLRPEFANFDAEKMIPIAVEPTLEHPECLCGAILQGLKLPSDCPLFGQACTPANPIGACMVSLEGTCAAYYRFRPAPTD